MLYRDNIEEVIKEYVLQGLKRTFEKAMKAEVLGYLKAKRYERKKDGMGSNLYILHICGASPMKELYFDELSTGLKN